MWDCMKYLQNSNNVYTLKLPTIFVAHPTFHISKLKLFLNDEKKPNQKQKMWLEVDVIE
jgi:hypothetical protein